jgi:hypothetical protein
MSTVRYQDLTAEDWQLLEARWRAAGEDRERWLREARAQRWVFILGVNNSGTTLLYEMLGQHPDMTLLPHEGQHLTRQLPLPAEAGCPRVWTERLDVFRLTEASHHIDAARVCHDWLQHAEPPWRRFLVEKSPADSIRALWLQAVFPDSWFIAIVRSGYAVAEGVRRREGYPLERCARHWSVANRLMLEDAERLRRFLLIRYEDLIVAPAGVARAMGDFLGVDPGPMESFGDSQLTVHNMDGSPSTLRDYNARSLERLSEAEIATINQHAGEMLERLGYLQAAPARRAR